MLIAARLLELLEALSVEPGSDRVCGLRGSKRAKRTMWSAQGG